MSKKYEICLEWPEFEEYFLEDYTLKTVKKYKECYNECYELPGKVCINYWYGDYKNGKSNIFWTFSDHEEKIHNLSYNGSSPFAMFWVSATDGNEEDEDDEEEADLKNDSECFVCEGCNETKEPDGHEVSCDECGKDHGCSECNGTWAVRERHFCEDCNTEHGCEMFCCDECGKEGLENDDTTYAMDGTFCNEGCLQNYIDLQREETEKKVNLTIAA